MSSLASLLVKRLAFGLFTLLQDRIVEQGAKQEILTAAHHEYTELLLSSVPEMDPDWLEGVLAKRKETTAHAV